MSEKTIYLNLKADIPVGFEELVVQFSSEVKVTFTYDEKEKYLNALVETWTWGIGSSQKRLFSYKMSKESAEKLINSLKVSEE